MLTLLLLDERELLDEVLVENVEMDGDSGNGRDKDGNATAGVEVLATVTVT